MSAAGDAVRDAGPGYGLVVGDRVGGRYRILRFLARGAMGEVYAAHDEELGATVALKTLRSQRADSGTALARFRREVLLTRELAHPGICRVFDLGVHEHRGGRLLFLTMELIAGETLAQRLDRTGPLSLPAARVLAEKLASALATAHAAGVIHRDLKPANIMLVADDRATGGERVVVTDFGLARRTAAAKASRGSGDNGSGSGGSGGGGSAGSGDPCGAGSDASDASAGTAGNGSGGPGDTAPASGDAANASATTTGALIGSPAYMAPEQVTGREVGPAADIYALGVVLFESLTGKLPFQGESALAMAAIRLERDAPPVSALRPEVGPRWDAVLGRCLARDPDRRFAHVDEVPSALDGVIEAALPPVPTRAEVRSIPWPGWRRPAVALAAALALVGAAVAALIAIASRDAQPGPELQAAAASAATHASAGAGALALPVAPAPPLVAVVPLRSMAARPESAWLGTAVAEMLTTDLGAGEHLRVVPSDAVGAAAGARGLALDRAGATPASDEADVRAVGAALAADYVISGSVVAVGEPSSPRVRIELRLRDGTSGKVVSQLGDDGQEAELFAIVSRLGGSAREAILTRAGGDALARLRGEPAPGAEAAPVHPRSIEAARAFAEGVAALRRYEAQTARARFERAVQLEPDSAKYHAGLASAWRTLQFPERARQSAERAFSLAAGLPRPERMFIEARAHEASRRFDRAIELYSALATFFPENIEYRLALGEVQNDAGRPRDALATVDRLRAEAGAGKSAGVVRDPRIDLLESAAADAMGDNERAARAALAAREQAHALGAEAMGARAEVALCRALTDRDVERALAACRAATAESAALGDRATTAMSLMNTAYLRERQKAPDEAMALLERAKGLYQEMGNVRGVGNVLNRIGVTLKGRGKLDQAIALQRQSLERLREAGDDARAGHILEGIASTEIERGELDAARRHYDEAIALERKVGDDRGVSISLQNVAWIEHDTGDLMAARRHAEEAIAMQEKLGAELDLVYSLECASIMALERDDLETAEKLLTRALALREKLKLAPYSALQNLAEVRLTQKRFPEARELIARSLAASSGGLGEGYAHEVESRILFEAGDIDGAARALKRSRELTGGRTRDVLDIDEARVLVARGQARRAIALAEHARAAAARRGAFALRIAADAALGEAEMAAGMASGGERLDRAEKESAMRGYTLMARLIAEAHAQQTAKAGAPAAGK
ncbi:MAG TPA: protein kinase [Kofleriaceae bacterium]|nr:protein kinase [Kofleriaceae bacterium]